MQSTVLRSANLGLQQNKERNITFKIFWRKSINILTHSESMAVLYIWLQYLVERVNRSFGIPFKYFFQSHEEFCAKVEKQKNSLDWFKKSSVAKFYRCPFKSCSCLISYILLGFVVYKLLTTHHPFRYNKS